MSILNGLLPLKSDAEKGMFRRKSWNSFIKVSFPFCIRFWVCGVRAWISFPNTAIHGDEAALYTGHHSIQILFPVGSVSSFLKRKEWVGGVTALVLKLRSDYLTLNVGLDFMHRKSLLYSLMGLSLIKIQLRRLREAWELGGVIIFLSFSSSVFTGVLRGIILNGGTTGKAEQIFSKDSLLSLN